MTTRDITLGVELARKALNEPSTDLLAFEEALKKKHQDFLNAGIVPVIDIKKDEEKKTDSSNQSNIKPKFKVKF